MQNMVVLSEPTVSVTWGKLKPWLHVCFGDSGAEQRLLWAFLPDVTDSHRLSSIPSLSVYCRRNWPHPSGPVVPVINLSPSLFLITLSLLPVITLKVWQTFVGQSLVVSVPVSSSVTVIQFRQENIWNRIYIIYRQWSSLLNPN